MHMKYNIGKQVYYKIEENHIATGILSEIIVNESDVYYKLKM